MACSRGQQALGKPGQRGDGRCDCTRLFGRPRWLPSIGRAGGQCSRPWWAATQDGVQAHANSSSVARKSRHSRADARMEGGEGWGAPSCRRCQQEAGGLQCRAQANEDPQEDGPLKTRRTTGWRAPSQIDAMSTSLGGSTAARPANGGLQRLQRANVGA